MSPGPGLNVSVGRTERSRWAPWWIYALVIIPANIGKEQFLADDLAWPLRAALTTAIPSGMRRAHRRL